MSPAPSFRKVIEPHVLTFPDHWKIFAKPSSSEADEPAETPINETPAIGMPMTTRAPRSSMRILIAEDDSISCKVLATWLQNWGYTPVITRDGAEAMAVMRGPDAPSMAVLDWMMPGMDGIEVCRRLRAVNKTVYIIFLTAMGAKENVYEALQAGADDYVIKPFDHLELEARIHVGERIIGLQRALQERVSELESLVLDAKTEDRTDTRLDVAI